MQNNSDLKHQWQIFAQNNNIQNVPYQNIDSYLITNTFKEYDNLLKQFTSVSIVTCPKCKDNNVDWKGVQTRRADEAQTIFCQCRNEHCKYKWRF
tara:strand:- start:816 stop:1100 length:285 start_codon:yes stop_codon:yes gene_type:complete